jgi:hypothetical protein
MIDMAVSEHVTLLLSLKPVPSFTPLNRRLPTVTHSYSWIAAMSAPQQPATLGRGEEAGSPPTPQVRPQRGSITSLLILSLIFLMMTNNGSGDGISARDQYMDSLSSLEWQLGNYSVWLNGSDTSNFTLVSGLHEHSYLPSDYLSHSHLDHWLNLILFLRLYTALAPSIPSFNRTTPISLALSGATPPSAMSARN